MFDISKRRVLPFLAGALILGATDTASTADLDSSQLASALGTVLASESFCGLHYDQDAIKKFIGEHVEKNDMEFAPTL